MEARAPKDPLLLCSGTKLAALIRRGEVSSREVVEAHIAQIERANPVVNAVVRDRFADARAEADRADAARAATDPHTLPSLHGVPCSIKECFAVAGLPQTGGLWSRRHHIANADATAVTRLRQAGAIPLGLTNVSELCMWMETHNTIYGRTRNPYDPRRIAGGSSGGEGAIVGAGGTPFGLGADIGGSIRMPAFFNGVFGHKPTGGLVPGTGQYPIAENKALRYLTTGPLARRAEDLMPLLRILAGPDGEDPGCRELALGDPASVDLAALDVIVVEDNGAQRVSEELKVALHRAAEALEAAGARRRTLKIEALRHSFDIWSSMLSAESTTSFAELLGNGRPARPMRELVKLALGRSRHTLPGLVLALLEKLPALTPKRARRFIERGRELREELIDLIGGGVLLFPPYTEVAPRHNRPLIGPFNWVYTAIFNVMELPVTQVPLGLNAEGVPLGVQVVGGPGADHLTIAVAGYLESRFGGWVPPPSLFG